MKKVLVRAMLALGVCSSVGSAFAMPYAANPVDLSVNQVTRDVYNYLIGRRGAAGGTNKMVEGQHLGGINDLLKGDADGNNAGLENDGKLDYEVHGIRAVVNDPNSVRYPGFVGTRYDAMQKYSLEGVLLSFDKRFETLDPELNKVLNKNLVDIWNNYHPIIQITASPRNPWDPTLGRLALAPNINNNIQQMGNLRRAATGLSTEDIAARNQFWTEMDIIAQGLRQLSDAGVPIILRPFAEWNTGSLSKWWGDKQTGTGFVGLWNDVVDYYTGTGTPGVPPGGKSVANQNLHNLLFCWEVWALNRGSVSANIAPFYPTSKVDIVGGSYYFKTEHNGMYVDENGNFTFANVNPPYDSDVYEFLVGQDRPFIASQFGLNNGSPDPGHHDETLLFMSYNSPISGVNPMAAAYYWDDPQQVERQGDATECARFVSDNRVATVEELPYTTVLFYSEAANDGYVRETNETAGTANFLDSTTNLRVGDTSTSTEKQYKSIASFNTYNLPDAKNIVSATLSLRRNTASGTPFEELGACKIDIKNGKFGTGASPQLLAYEDFSNTLTPASELNVVTNGMPKPANNGDWSDGYLNAKGIAQVNRTGNTQFRIYFNLDDDDHQDNDYIDWYSGNAAVGSQPVLSVTYRN